MGVVSQHGPRRKHHSSVAVQLLHGNMRIRGAITCINRSIIAYFVGRCLATGLQVTILLTLKRKYKLDTHG